MERESILTVIPPAENVQSLPDLTKVNESLDEVNDGKQHKLNSILVKSATNIKSIGKSNSTPAPILLSTFPSTHEDLTEHSEENDEHPADYQSLPDEDHDSALFEFLTSLEMTRQDVDDAQVPWKALSKLYQTEFSCASGLKWSSLDHALEKNLQWPLLSPSDVGTGDPQKCDYRVRLQERSILLKTTGGLIKAYAVRGFVQGLETGLLKSVHYFIYAMLAYRLEELVITGRSEFKEFQAIFEGSNQKGIDSLVRSLAQLDAHWLKLILAAPLILGVLQGIIKICSARPISTEEVQKIADRIQTDLKHSGSFCQDVVLEETPLLSSFLSLSSQVQKLEQWVRWDGRLGPRHRKQVFELIRRVAREGRKITQLNALESLAKIAHGIGLKDLPRLRRAGYSSRALIDLLYIKATALNDLEVLSQKEFQQEQISQSAKAVYSLASLPRRLYASYFLWWLGQSTSWWTQRLPFALLKIVKLGLEALFLQEIVASILEAIHCPDKPGFQFGTGYEDWASDYTVTCFTTRLKLFRTIDMNESVAILVAEIPSYHLTELTELYLSFKYLTAQEAESIIQAVVQQSAPLQILNLANNQLRILSTGMFRGLSQLNTLNLMNNQLSVLSQDIFRELSQLSSLDLWGNALNLLSEGVFNELSRLTFLDLGGNRLSVVNEGVFSRLSQLKSLSLGPNYLSILSKDVFKGLSQLKSLNLAGNELSFLSEGLFDELSQLDFLGLYSNRLYVLNESVFRGLYQLTYLHLGSNQLSLLSERVFNGLGQLVTLELGWNQLTVFSEDVFSGLSQLKNLYLYYNQLKVLNAKVFSGLNQLQLLFLNQNYLNTTVIVDILSSLPITLTTLDISSNEISYLPQNFSRLLPISLKTLSTGNNSFIPQTLTREFMQYFPTWLTSFDIEYSGITNITKGCFSDFFVLTDLWLARNRLTVLNEGTFNELSQLKWLDLGYNQLHVLSEDVFNSLSQLNFLRLWGNKLSVLNANVFSRLTQLNDLELSYNRLSILSKDVFSGLSQLKYLSLNSNFLSVLSKDVFNGLSQLEYLNLYYNLLSSLNKDVFTGMSQIIGLGLDGNHLNVLSEGIFIGLNQLDHLGLGNNQLNDTAIKNITQNFPYQLRSLSVNNNNIGNEGALALAKVFPCSNLSGIYFENNPANDTLLALLSQQKALKKVCDDQRCHANLLATESCGVNTNPSTTVQMNWGLFDNIDEVDETKSDFSDYSYWPHPAETSSFQPVLVLPGTTSESSSLLLTTKTAGAVILGMVGLSILFYKNSTWMQAIVNTGNNLFQRCWSSGKSEEDKTTPLVSSSNRRYTLFEQLSTFCSQKSSSFTKMSEHHQNFSI